MIVITYYREQLIDGQYVPVAVSGYKSHGVTSRCCGASDQQKETYDKQSKLMDTLTSQAKDVFGDSSQVFGDLMKAFSPIVAAGPWQEGFSAAEKSSLQAQAVDQTGKSYDNAKRAVGERIAATGGGNTVMPSGAAVGAQAYLANEGASETSRELNTINLQDYETGRENFWNGAKGLSGTTNTFNTATQAGDAAVGAGRATSDTADQIAQANNSVWNAAIGALGAVGGAAVTGGLSAAFPKKP